MGAKRAKSVSAVTQTQPLSMAKAAWILTEATEDGPMAGAGPDGDATGLDVSRILCKRCR